MLPHKKPPVADIRGVPLETYIRQYVRPQQSEAVNERLMRNMPGLLKKALAASDALHPEWKKELAKDYCLIARYSLRDCCLFLVKQREYAVRHLSLLPTDGQTGGKTTSGLFPLLFASGMGGTFGIVTSLSHHWLLALFCGFLGGSISVLGGIIAQGTSGGGGKRQDVYKKVVLPKFFKNADNEAVRRFATVTVPQWLAAGKRDAVHFALILLMWYQERGLHQFIKPVEQLAFICNPEPYCEPFGRLEHVYRRFNDLQSEYDFYADMSDADWMEVSLAALYLNPRYLFAVSDDLSVLQESVNEAERLLDKGFELGQKVLKI